MHIMEQATNGDPTLLAAAAAWPAMAKLIITIAL